MTALVEIYVWIGAAVVVGVLSSARLTRLVVNDTFPPVEWLKFQFIRLVRGSESWSKLVQCPWCLAPYATAAVLAWAVLSDLHWTWWAFNGWLAAAYVASMIVWRDED